jgi:uncharacterized membrane protein YeaQ/YmgE (transglycosylase-associated protein family)
MNLLEWCVFLGMGAIVGRVPGFFMRNQSSTRILLDVLGGVCGAFIGAVMIVLMGAAGAATGVVALLICFSCSVIGVSLSRHYRPDAYQGSGRYRSRRLYH